MVSNSIVIESKLLIKEMASSMVRMAWLEEGS